MPVLSPWSIKGQLGTRQFISSADAYPRRFTLINCINEGGPSYSKGFNVVGGLYRANATENINAKCIFTFGNGGVAAELITDFRNGFKAFFPGNRLTCVMDITTPANNDCNAFMFASASDGSVVDSQLANTGLGRTNIVAGAVAAFPIPAFARSFRVYSRDNTVINAMARGFDAGGVDIQGVLISAGYAGEPIPLPPSAVDLRITNLDLAMALNVVVEFILSI